MGERREKLGGGRGRKGEVVELTFFVSFRLLPFSLRVL